MLQWVNKNKKEQLTIYNKKEKINTYRFVKAIVNRVIEFWSIIPSPRLWWAQKQSNSTGRNTRRAYVPRFDLNSVNSTFISTLFFSPSYRSIYLDEWTRQIAFYWDLAPKYHNISHDNDVIMGLRVNSARENVVSGHFFCRRDGRCFDCYLISIDLVIYHLVTTK